MRVVLYAQDFEPITVIELPEFAVGYLKKHGFVRIPVPTSLSVTTFCDNEPPSRSFPIVEVFAEKLRFPQGEHLMLFTKNEEAALLLKSAFLPGQRFALQEVERKAFARGFIDALQRLCE